MKLTLNFTFDKNHDLWIGPRFVRHHMGLRQTVEQYRYDQRRESIWRWVVIAAIVAGFVGLPIVGFILWGMLT